jgi:hypothetical protein
MSSSGRHHVITLEHRAPYRTLPQFAADASPALKIQKNRPQAILGLPARTPVLSFRNSLATVSPEQLDAA